MGIFQKLFPNHKKEPVPEASLKTLPYPLIKMDWDEFISDPLKTKEPTIYIIKKDGFDYDFLVNRVARSKEAVIFGTGDFLKKYVKPPYFARHSWIPSLKVNSLWYFDSDCHKGDVTLRWCYGNNSSWRLEKIAEILEIFFKRWGIEKSLFYGSSGAGFTALALACLMRSKAIAINPQLLCLKFWNSTVNNFLKVALKEGEEVIEERLDLAMLIEREKYCPEMKIIQNIHVANDLETQLLPFLDKLRNIKLVKVPLELEFFTHPDGHNAMPDKDHSIAEIHQALGLKR